MAKTNPKKVALGVGLGLAAAVAAGAGYYFYGSKDAKSNRKKAAKWANDMEAQVKSKAKKLKKLDEKAYKTIVDETMKAYTKVKSIDQDDLRGAALELKSNWKNVKKELDRVATAEAAHAKGVAKKAVKTVKKAVAKNVKTVKKVVAAKPKAKAKSKKKSR